MKNNYLTILLIINSYIAFSQSLYQGYDFTLDKSIGGNLIYEASESILLTKNEKNKTSFHYKPDGSGYFSFHGWINPLVLYPPNGELGGPSVEDNGLVGTMGGKHEVSNNGALIYTLPIKVPVGVNGMQPNISLTYNSQQGNGILGIGWSLTGVSSITRVGSTNFHDSHQKGIEFNCEDHFAIDGNRLLSINGQYGNNLTEYRTENETYRKIISFTSLNEGPEYFRVWSKDGSIIEYGATEDSRIELQNTSGIGYVWLINKTIDRFGNSIEYHYSEDNINGFYKLIEIKYAETCKISFSYKSRTDGVYKYLSPSKGNNQPELIEKIMISVNDHLQYSYNLRYDETFWSQLQSIQLEYANTSNTTNVTKLNPIEFGYGKTQFTGNLAPISGVQYSYNYAGQEFTYDATRSFMADFNGDGIQDFFVIYTWDQGTKIDGFHLYYYDGGSFVHSGISGSFNLDATEYKGIYPGDLNGDGMIDYILRKEYSSKTEFIPYIFTGSAFERQTSFYVYESKRCKVYLADFNGDYKAELVALIEPWLTSKVIFKTYKFVFNPNFQWISLADEEDKNANIDDLFTVADMTADGKPEIIRVESGGSFYYEFLFDPGNTIADPVYMNFPNTSHDFWWGDFNADGFTDVLTQNKSSKEFSLNIFNGLEFYSHPAIPDFPNKTDAIYAVADYTGDGYADISMSYIDKEQNINIDPPFHDGIRKHIFEFNGNVFKKLTAFYYIDEQNQTVLEADVSHIIGDFNSNGSNDFLFQTNHFNGNEKMLYRAYTPSNLTYLLNTLTNEYDYEVKINYINLLDISLSHYNKYHNAEYPLRDLVGPLSVVKNITCDDGKGETREKEYYYEGAKLHLGGRGFLGFSQIKIYDPDAQTYIINKNKLYNEINFVLFVPESSEIYYKNELSDPLLLSDNNYTYEIYNGIDHNWGKRHAIYLIQSQTREWALDGNFIKTTRMKNSYGDTDYIYGNEWKKTLYNSNTNIEYTEDETTFQDGEELVTNYDYSYINDWLIDRPVDATTRFFANNESEIFLKTSYTYFPRSTFKYPLVQYLRINEASELEMLTTFDYNTNGLVVSKITSCPNFNDPTLQNREIRYNYDPNHEYRFLTNTTNSLGYAENYMIDEEKGIISKIIDQNGFQIELKYDIIGRQTKRILADKTEEVSVLRWISKDNCDFKEGALWYSWECKTGTKPVINIYDALGRVMRSVSFNSRGQKIYIDKEFDHFGRLIEESVPHYAENNVYENISISYDVLNRQSSLSIPNEPNLPPNKITYRYGSNYKEVEFSNGTRTKEFYNNKGEIVSVLDENNDFITHKYSSNGLIKWTKVNDNANSLITYTYDINGNVTSSYDQTKGLISYEYNPYSELVYSKNNGNKVYYHYDQLGRLFERINVDCTDNSIETKWTYSNIEPTRGLIRKISQGPDTNPTHMVNYFYDELNRKSKEIETIDNTNFETSYYYDYLGRLERQKYPNGLYLTYLYKQGHLKAIKTIRENSEIVAWENIESNEFDSPTLSKLGNKSLTKTYNSGTNTLHTIESPGIQKFELTFDNLGNLNKRHDQIYNLCEEFTYDQKNRLTSIIKSNATTNVMYDDLSNIDFQDNVGEYTYKEDGTKPYQIESLITSNLQNQSYKKPEEITYNSLNKVNTIESDGYKLEISYGINNERISQSLSQIDNPNHILEEKIYITDGLTEIVKYVDGKTKTINYIYSPEGIIGAEIEISDGTTSTRELYWIFTDFLGSITAIVRDSDNYKIELSYDCWGNRRSPQTWEVYDGNQLNQINLIIDRGYTSHEHLDKFGLINMNGRVYDPTLARFISPDPINNLPHCPSNYNLYSYCLNNPFKYTDPTGKSVIAQILIYLGWSTAKNAYENRDPETGKWKLDLKNATYIIGINTTTNFSNFTCYAGANFNNESSIFIGYNSESGLGYGGNPNYLFFPNYDYLAIEINAVNSIYNNLLPYNNFTYGENEVPGYQRILTLINASEYNKNPIYDYTYLPIRVKFQLLRVSDYKLLSITTRVPHGYGLKDGQYVKWETTRYGWIGHFVAGVYFNKIIYISPKIVRSLDPWVFKMVYVHEFIHYFQDVHNIPYEKREYEAYYSGYQMSIFHGVPFTWPNSISKLNYVPPFDQYSPMLKYYIW